MWNWNGKRCRCERDEGFNLQLHCVMVRQIQFKHLHRLNNNYNDWRLILALHTFDAVDDRLYSVKNSAVFTFPLTENFPKPVPLC
jgi:hypothetical protein